MTEEEFDELRPTAFAVAYRMLGSVSEAEDVVQEGLLRLHRARESGERIASPRAYLSTVVSRLALDQLRSARARRESYVGEWLPEPLVASADDDPARQAEMADSLSLAFLVLLESLSPEQRAAFLLREVFDEPYERIAEIIGTSEQNARQLATRARRHVEERRPHFEATRQHREHARRIPARRHRLRLHLPPGAGERATGRALLRPRGQADQRDVPRPSGGSDPGRERDRQPGQAAAPGTARRPGRPAARVEVTPKSHGPERRDDARRLASRTNPHGCAQNRISRPLTFTVTRIDGCYGAYPDRGSRVQAKRSPPRAGLIDTGRITPKNSEIDRR